MTSKYDIELLTKLARVQWDAGENYYLEATGIPAILFDKLEREGKNAVLAGAAAVLDALADDERLCDPSNTVVHPAGVPHRDCFVCQGTGLTPSGVDYYGSLEMIGCDSCLGTGIETPAPEETQ